jgi:dihydrofolate synthase/folylpolyglutamate synthase
MEVQPQGSSVILKRLEKLHPKRIDLSLGRIGRLLTALDDPQTRLPPVVHVAGTNGKGSVVAFLEATLQAAGHSVHTYVSPHLVNFHERIRLAQSDGGTLPIGEPELNEILAVCETENGNAPITFFEITTAAAMLAFVRHPADILLLEVGLGGRLDATNVVETPAISVITPVSIDHTQFLGNELAGIAAEKAGILKKGVPAVIAPQDRAALEPIVARAATVGAPLLRHGMEWDYQVQGGGKISLHLDSRQFDLPHPSLIGSHQTINAATAAATLLSLPGFDISEDNLRCGLQSARWPGRLQRIERGLLGDLLSDGTELWLDGGHNASAGAVLADTLATWHEMDDAHHPIYLISGLLNTKDVSAFFKPFANDRLVDGVYGIPILGEPASLSGEDVAGVALQVGLDAQAADSVEMAIEMIAQKSHEAPARVLICGSLHLAGQILARLG